MKFFLPSVLFALALMVSVGCQPESDLDDADVSTDVSTSVEPVDPVVESNVTDTVETPDSNLTGEVETPE